jgi:hypothetical protein
MRCTWFKWAALFSGLVCAPSLLAAGEIFISSPGVWPTNVGTVGAYNLDGSVVNPALITGLNNPQRLSVVDDKIYVANTANYQTVGTVGLYTTTGTPLNPTLITGLHEPAGLAISGNDLLVSNSNGGGVGHYTISGTTIDPAFIPFFNHSVTMPVEMAVAGNDLFVVDMMHNAVGKFTTTGATINAVFINLTGINGAGGLAVSDGKLYVDSRSGANGAGRIGEYDAATGAAINTALVTGLDYPAGLSIFDNHLFVVNYGTAAGSDMFKGYIGEYNLDGSAVNTALITGLTNPIDIAVAPEPAALGVMVLVLGPPLLRRRRRTRHLDCEMVGERTWDAQVDECLPLTRVCSKLDVSASAGRLH